MGMIQKEYVRNVTNNGNGDDDDGAECVCDSFQPIDGPGIVDEINHVTVVGASTTTMTSSGRAYGAGVLCGLVNLLSILLLYYY